MMTQKPFNSRNMSIGERPCCPLVIYTPTLYTLDTIHLMSTILHILENTVYSKLLPMSVKDISRQTRHGQLPRMQLFFSVQLRPQNYLPPRG